MSIDNLRRAAADDGPLGLATQTTLAQIDIKPDLALPASLVDPGQGFLRLVPFNVEDADAVDFAIASLDGVDPRRESTDAIPRLDDFASGAGLDLTDEEIVFGFGVQPGFAPATEVDAERTRAEGVVTLPWRARGLHIARAGDIPASGRLVEFIGVTCLDPANQATMRLVFDRLELFSQMGVPIAVRPAQDGSVALENLVERPETAIGVWVGAARDRENDSG